MTEGSSKSSTDELLSIVAGMLAKHGEAAPFTNHKGLYSAIDSVTAGKAPWTAWVYDGAAGEEVTRDSPSWKKRRYRVYYRDPSAVIKNMLADESFEGEFDYVPFAEFNKKSRREYHDLMSAQWAWDEAVRLPA